MTATMPRVRWAILLTWLVLISAVKSNNIDIQMQNLAADIGDSFTSISLAHDHKVDWMFVVDHGGFKQTDLHLEYSKYFIQQLASHLYISPTYSQAGVLTYGSKAVVQIPLDIQSGNQCDFNVKVNHLVMTPGQSDMNGALEEAITQLQTKGRDTAHKVTVLITTAGWQNVGVNPFQNVAKVKQIGTLIVVILVFNRAESIVAPVILSFASERKNPVRRAGEPVTVQTKYAFELEAKRGNLRRLYRHFLLATQQMDYKPLQVPSTFCPTCADGQACVCDVNLFNTYHCEKDTYGPLLTLGCPADQDALIDLGHPYTIVSWRAPQAVDFSTSMKSEVITEHEDELVYRGLFEVPSDYNGTFKQYKSFIGKTQVTHRFYDGSGNSVNCSFQIEIFDNESPTVFKCPTSTVYVNTTGYATQDVDWPEITATDNSKRTPSSLLYVNGALRDNSNRTFSIGSSAVRLIFTDKSLNTASCDFTVKVEDHEAPVVQQCAGPDSTIYSSDTQAYVDWAPPQFIDNSGKNVTISGDQEPGYFRIGRHTVNYNATDVFGNSDTCDFSFTVRGYPCPELPAPYNGGIICDNAVPGAACQIFCQNPLDFEPIAGQPTIPNKYSCVGTGKWYPTDKVPHCVVRQGTFKKLTNSYYYDGKCSDINVSNTIKTNAVNHYAGFVEGGYFREAWGRQIASQDFNDPRCGAEAAITTSTSTTSTTTTTPATTTTSTTVPTTVPTTTTSTTTTTIGAPVRTLSTGRPTRPTTPATSSAVTRTLPTATTAPPSGIGGNVVRMPDGTVVIG